MHGLAARAGDSKTATNLRIRALTLMQLHGSPPSMALLQELLQSDNVELRAHAVYLLDIRGKVEFKDALLVTLKDPDAMVRRRACEALIRIGIEPPVEAIWPLLGEEDRFVRTAARLVLQRIDPKKWRNKLNIGASDTAVREAIVALCKEGLVQGNELVILAALSRWRVSATTTKQEILDSIRVHQLVCCHPSYSSIEDVGDYFYKMFPHKDNFINRELAILLTHLRRTKVINSPVHAKLLSALAASTGDREQQIHYFYCLRLLHDGWTKEQKDALADWFEQTRTWSGGNSFTPFLANIFRESLGVYDLESRKAILADGLRKPQTSLILAQRLAIDRQPELLPAPKKLAGEVATAAVPRTIELRNALSEAILRTACEHPKPEYYADLLQGLSSSNKLMVFDALVALRKIGTKPRPDDPMPYRMLLMATRRLDAGNRWKAVELLRHWSSNKQFGAEEGQAQLELTAWAKWFGQTFPKEPKLPDVEGDKPAPSKYKFDELLEYVTKGAGQKGDVKRGRVVFEKAQCIKCHKYGKEGEGIGPDLTTLAKRFKRIDVLESIYYPSKVISDQYRSTMIVTFKGQRVEGLAAVQGDMITVLQSDGSKLMLRKKDIEQQFASLLSVMPEKLLDPLTKAEIADLFAFLESET